MLATDSVVPLVVQESLLGQKMRSTKWRPLQYFHSPLLSVVSAITKAISTLMLCLKISHIKPAFLRTHTRGPRTANRKCNLGRTKVASWVYFNCLSAISPEETILRVWRRTIFGTDTKRIRTASAGHPPSPRLWPQLTSWPFSYQRASQLPQKRRKHMVK